MKKNYFWDRCVFRGFIAVFFLCMIFIIPQQLEAQVSSEAEKAFREAGIRILKNKQNPVNLTLPLLGGGNGSLSSYKGKVVILNFWATWCPPCRSEMPSMETLYQHFKNQGLQILAVDMSEERDVVQQFVRSNRYTFPVLLDIDGKVGSQYGISAIPTTYILDREGKIIGRIVGSIRWDNPKVITAFEELLKSR
jgi:thiol-disulfide isomerase/thioredoxin